MLLLFKCFGNRGHVALAPSELPCALPDLGLWLRCMLTHAVAATVCNLFRRYLGFNHPIDNLIASSIESSLAENKRRARRAKQARQAIGHAEVDQNTMARVAQTLMLGILVTYVLAFFASKRPDEQDAASDDSKRSASTSKGGMQGPLSRAESGPEWTPRTPVKRTSAGLEYRTLVPDALNRSEYNKENEVWKNVTGQLIATCPNFKLGTVKCIHTFESTTAGGKYRECRNKFQEQQRSDRAGSIGQDKTKVEWVFHGTPELEVAFSIVQEGFKIGAGNDVYGQGIYSAIDPTEPLEKYGNDKVVVMCRGLVGNQYRHHAESASEEEFDKYRWNNFHKEAHKEGYDSWEPNTDYRVFKASEQLLPEYVIERL